MDKLLRILRLLITGITIMLLIFFVWNCLDILFNEGEFTYDLASSRLEGCILPIILYLLLIVTTLLIQQKYPYFHNDNPSETYHTGISIKAQYQGNRPAKLRWILLVCSILLVLWGIANGSFYDVFVKSINICTECIGLG